MSSQTPSKTTSPSPRKFDTGTPDLTRSELYRDWYRRVAAGKPNDFIVVISADPRYTGVSGTGKTTLGLDLAKNWFDQSDNGFDAEQKATLDPHQLAQEIYPQTDELSCLLYDEAQGTLSTTGLNSKRAMKEESLNAINTIATRRSDRKTLIVITQSLKSIVKDLYDFIDAWLLIFDETNYVATHYGVHPDVFNLERRETRTPGIEEIEWQYIPESDPDYSHLSKLKQQSTRPASDDSSDAKLPKEQQMELAQEYRNLGKSLQWIEDNVDAITYSRETVRKNTVANPEDKTT